MSELQTRRLGRTGRRVTTFGLGGQASIQWPAGGTDPLAIVEKAVRLGVTYLDTSNVYGPSQKHFGEAFRRLHLIPGEPGYDAAARSRLFIATKTHVRTARKPEGFRFRSDFSEGMLDAFKVATAVDDVRRSLSLMFGDGQGGYPEGAYLDSLQFHDLCNFDEVDMLYEGLDNPSPERPLLGALAALLDLREGENRTACNPKREKLVRHIGITGHWNSAVHMEAIQRDSKRLIDTLLVTINLQARSGREKRLELHRAVAARTTQLDVERSLEQLEPMGLAAYGEDDDALYKRLRSMLVVNGTRLDFAENFELLRLWRQLDPLCRTPGTPTIEAANLARAGQRVFTDVLLALLRALRESTGAEHLALGGGCALNSSANGRIVAETGFSALHVYSAPADDGNAIGAALLAYQEDHHHERVPRFTTPYLGSRLSDEALENVARFGGLKLTKCQNDAPERAAELLARGRIIGWIQGRAEMGPRALGNRSILADPRSPGIRDQINARVKFREEFRPLAPSILSEFGPAYLEDYQPAPYMERTLRFREQVRGRVPGVVHRDGTGRLQTVTPEANERYYRLLQRFHTLTEVPLILNTSFNVMGKPISHSVEDVLAVFFTSGLDAVFLDDLLIEK